MNKYVSPLSMLEVVLTVTKDKTQSYADDNDRVKFVASLPTGYCTHARGGLNAASVRISWHDWISWTS